MLKRLTFLFIASFLAACSDVQSSASRVLDNAGSVTRSAGDKMIMEPVKPTGRIGSGTATSNNTDEEKEKKPS